MKIGIRGKLVFIIAGILFIVLSTNTYLQMNLQNRAFDHELQKRTLLLSENLQQKVISTAEILRDLIAENVAAYKFLELNNTVKQVAEDTNNLVKIVILDKQNQVYIDTEKNNHSDIHIKDADSKIQLPTYKNIPDSYEVRQVQVNNSEALEFKIPINIGQEVWGYLLLTYSLSELNNHILESTRTHESQQKALAIRMLLISLSLLFFGYLTASHISKRLMLPIITLTNYTREIARGDFSQVEEISYRRDDEIGVLTQNFVAMANNIEESQKALANYNQTLEQKVEQRTFALNLNNAALKQALSDLEESQQQLIHSEKMAALGQLIAGIAHEINTPLGAIQASAGNNSKSFRRFEKDLPNYLAHVSEDEKNLLTLLLNKSIAKIEKGIISSTREERQQKKLIFTFLDGLKIQHVHSITEFLLDMVNVEDLDELAPFLNNKNTLRIVELAHHLSALERNNQTILTAISKASKVVFSLKNFSHHDMTGKKILSDINFGIQTVLVLYQNFLKQGCTVVENFGELPELLCYPDELNQVWTNLIHNALYAMQNVGTLTIDTRVENNTIVVSMTDDGSGIPKEIQGKIFTSFFTTKPAGEGSGLGLGICKRIIDKHEGDITFVSKPGETTFTVRLPILES